MLPVLPVQHDCRCATMQPPSLPSARKGTHTGLACTCLYKHSGTCIGATFSQLLHAGCASLHMRQTLKSFRQHKKRELRFRSAGSKQHTSPQAAAGSTGGSSNSMSNSVASATTRNTEASTPALQQAASHQGQAHEQGKYQAISNLVPKRCAAAPAET